MYDNSSFLSNASITKSPQLSTIPQDLHKNYQTLNLSMNLNRNKRNAFVKSKFHSVVVSNQGAPIGREQRFLEGRKKLTDRVGYQAHRSI